MRCQSAQALYEHIARDLSTVFQETPGNPYRIHVANRLLEKTFSRYIGDDHPTDSVIPDEVMTEACWNSFLESNSRVNEVNSRVKKLEFAPFTVQVLTSAKALLERWLNEPIEIDGELQVGCDIKSLADGLSVGPGASLGISGSSFWSKFLDGVPTFYQERPDICRLFDSLLNARPIWKKAELERRQLYGKYAPVESSIFGTVPKSTQKKRGIATEATINMAVQLSLGKLIATRLKFFTGIDVHDQTLNQELARIGSIHGTLATLDLSAASDSRSYELDRWLLPSDWFGWLDIARSKRISGPNGEVVDLSMTSTMGNGYTFALMTMVNAAICSSVITNLGHPCFYPSKGTAMCNLAVYGDDIIVPTDCAVDVINVLSDIGFLVNTDKSYLDGPFRESCGADWYHGRPSRPFFVTGLTSDVERMTLANLVSLWSCLHGIPMPNTYKYLVEDIPSRFYVPLQAGLGAGLCVPGDIIADVPSVHAKKQRRFHGRWTYVHQPRIKSVKVVPRDGTHDFRHVCAALQGCYVQGRVTGRQLRVTYDQVLVEFSSWDFVPLELGRAGRLWGVPNPTLMQNWISAFRIFYGQILTPG